MNYLYNIFLKKGDKRALWLSCCVHWIDILVKDGKLAAKGEDKSEHAVNGVSVSSVGKALSTPIIAIRNTVDSGLKI